MIFAVQMMGWELALFPRLEEPTLGQVLEAEKKLLVFARWLSRDYASATTIQYIGEVKKEHTKWLGAPLEAMKVVFFRLPVLCRMLKRERPGKKRQKTPWEFQSFDRVRDAHGQGASQGSFGPGAKGFEKATTYTVMLLAFEHLLRLNELVRTQTGTAADKDPLQYADVRFFGRGGRLLGWQQNGQPVGDPVVMVVRMPPSKIDQMGASEVTLRSPFPRGWERGEAPNAAGPAMWRYMTRFPVTRGRAGITPLFRIHQTLQSARLTKSVFTRVFHELCRKADIQYSQYGIHCFRVGGMNRLMDLGATAPQICAMGRWQGDCWQLYARRERSRLEGLTLEMSQGPASA